MGKSNKKGKRHKVKSKHSMRINVFGCLGVVFVIFFCFIFVLFVCQWFIYAHSHTQINGKINTKQGKDKHNKQNGNHNNHNNKNEESIEMKTMKEGTYLGTYICVCFFLCFSFFLFVFFFVLL